MKTLELITVKKSGHEYQVMILEKIRLLWFRRNNVFTYKGGGTVYHLFPSGQRASTSMEAWICYAVEGAKMRNEIKQNTN